MSIEEVPGSSRRLADGVPHGVPDALSLLSLGGQLTSVPRDGLEIRFGRNRPDVDLCVGEDDLQVSRVHGVLRFQGRQWWLTNTGRTPIRLPHALQPPDAERYPLSQGYTPLYVLGSRGREHLLEVYVAGPDGRRPQPRPTAETAEPRRWRLTDDERLALVTIGQRYLLQDPQAQPLSRQQAADELLELYPAGHWTSKKVEHLIADVRKRLSASGVYGLRRDEVGEPIGLSLVANLLNELTRSTSLAATDLRLLEPPDQAATAD